MTRLTPEQEAEILNELKAKDDLNILSQACKHGSSSGLWVAWAILQNRTEPKIRSVIEKWQDTGGDFRKLRKMIMWDSLERILDWYKSNVPNYKEDFLPGLTYEQIEYQVKDLPFKLPQEIYDLYQWRNGSSGQSVIFVYHYFSPLEVGVGICDNEYFNYSETVDSRIKNLYPPYLFPVFETDTECFAVGASADEAETALVFNIGEGDEILAFNSLTTMLMAIAESYEAGVYRYTHREYENIDWEDMEKSGQIRLKYNIGTTRELYYRGGG